MVVNVSGGLALVRSRTLAVDVRDDRWAAERLVDDGRRAGVPAFGRSADQPCDLGGLRVPGAGTRPGPDVRPVPGLAARGRARMAGIAAPPRFSRWAGHWLLTSFPVAVWW